MAFCQRLVLREIATFTSRHASWRSWAMSSTNWVLGAESAEEVLIWAQEVVRMGVEFKQRAPLTQHESGGQKGVDDSAITNSGMPLATLVEWLKTVVFPG